MCLVLVCLICYKQAPLDSIFCGWKVTCCVVRCDFQNQKTVLSKVSKSVAQFDCLMSMQSCMTGYQVYKHFCMVTVKEKLHVLRNKDGNGASNRLLVSSCGKWELTTLTSFFHLHHFLTLALLKISIVIQGTAILALFSSFGCFTVFF